MLAAAEPCSRVDPMETAKNNGRPRLARQLEEALHEYGIYDVQDVAVLRGCTTSRAVGPC